MKHQMKQSLRSFYREKLLCAMLRQDKASENRWNEMLRTLTKTEAQLKKIKK